MTEIVKLGTANSNGVVLGAPSLSMLPPPVNCYLPPLALGENVVGYDALYLDSATNKLFRSIVNLLAAPVVPVAAGNGAGSQWGAGTYLVQTTFNTAIGETTPSPALAVTVTAAQNIRVNAYNAVDATVTSMNYYVNGVFAGTTAVGGGNIAQTDLTGAALAAGRSIPRDNGAFKDRKYRVHGYAAQTTFSPYPCTPMHMVLVGYTAASVLTPGPLYVSSTVPGGLTDVPVTKALDPCAYAVDDTQIWTIRTNR